MTPQAKDLNDKTPVEVKLSTDNNGIVSLGIRINGSNVYVLSSMVTVPKPGSSQTWSKTIGDVMKAPPSTFP
jgi:hypothetical protein